MNKEGIVFALALMALFLLLCMMSYHILQMTRLGLTF